MSEYRRRVSGGEKLMIAYNELRPPFVIQLVLEGEGDPKPEALYEALQQATAANPGARLRLEEGPGDDDFWVLGPEPTFTVVEDPSFRAQGTDEAEFLRWRLDASTGPTCELVHVRGEQGRGYLIFRALHAVMDGQGTLLWAKDFMRCLRGESPVGHPGTADVHKLTEHEAENRRPLPAYDALHPLGLPKPTTTDAYGWRRVHIDRPLSSDAFGRIAVAVRELAAAHHDEPGPIRLHLPTDLRGYFRKERSTANLFGSLFVDVEPDETAEAIGRKVLRMLYERDGQRPAGLYTSVDPGSVTAHRVKVFFELSRMHETGRYPFSATVSHLGRLEGAALSGPGWRSTSGLFVPLISEACAVSLNGFDDHIEVTVGVTDRFHHDGRLERLAQAVGDALRAE